MRLRDDYNARYFHELYRTPHFAKESERWSYGITSDMWSLRPEHFKMIYSALPPREEQDAIVRFLDHANRRIERYIRAKKKLIALLNEQKQAIIHRAVTRGLDLNVRLRPSGIPWLGDIPEHWEATRLKRCVTPIEQGWSPQCDAQPAGDNEWGVLKVGCVNRDDFDSFQNKKLPETLQPIESLEVQDGDILVSRANTRELLGLAAIAVNPRPKLLLCDKLFRFRVLSQKADPRFLVYAVRAQPSRDQIESSTNGASDSMQNIGQAVIRNLWVAMSSIEEQQAIVRRIIADTAQLASNIKHAEREIALIREYRTRLVADVVTGQLDVREAAAKLPEAPREEDIEMAEDSTEDEAEASEFEETAGSGTIG